MLQQLSRTKEIFSTEHIVGGITTGLAELVELRAPQPQRPVVASELLGFQKDLVLCRFYHGNSLQAL
jgi:hypothetical protein